MKVKEKSSSPDAVMVVKVKPLDEDVDAGYKKDPLHAEFTGPSIKPEEESVPPISFFKLFRFTTTGEAILLFLASLGAITTGLCSPANILIFGDLTDTMISNNPMLTNSSDGFMDGINDFALNNTYIGIIMLVCSYLSIMIFNYVAQRQIYRIRDLFLKSALQQDIGWYDLHQSGDLASRMSEDLTKLEEGIGEKISMFIHFQVAFIGSLVLAFMKGWELALVCLISFPVTMISMGIVAIVSSKLAKQELEAYGKAGSIAEEVLSSMRTVIAFGGQEKEAERYSKNLVYARNINVKRGFFNGLGFGLLWFFIYASYALAFWYGVGLVIDKDDSTYTPAVMVTVFFGVMMGSMNFGMASPLIETFGISKGAGAKVFAIIDRVSPINSWSSEGEQPSNINGSIKFSNVHFEYPSRKDVKILKGLNLTINRGETVALVGSSGCGKSTCIQLIQRFYDPIQGTVELDGMDLKNLNVAWLRSQIGVVGQEPVLFQTTIAENIRYGRDSVTKEEIIAAAKEANAHDFISKLPQGYDTLVGERGAQISGGQKQRIAIARALVRKPTILLLDEATSALDTGSEAKVQKALDQASRGRTTIIVAHRLSTIRGADKIVVLSEGKVVEEGTHEKLMELRGHYHALVTAQISPTEPTDDNEAEKKEKQALRRMVSVVSETSTVADDEDEIPQYNTADYDDKPTPVSMYSILKTNSPEWVYILIGTLSSVVMGCAMPIFAVLFGEILGVLSLPDPDEVRSETNIYCLYFVLAGVAVGIATFLQIYTFGVAGEQLTMRLRGMAFSAMLRQEIAWFDDKTNNTGALCSRLSGEAASVQGATGQRIGTVIQSLATLVLGVGLAMYYEWRLGLVTLSFTPVILVANYLFHNIMAGETLSTQSAMEKSTQQAVEAVSNIRTVAGLGRERLFHSQYMAELLPAHKLALRNTHIRAVIFGLARSIMFFAYATCMYYGGQLIVDEHLPYEDVFKVSQALIMGTVSIANAMAFAPNFQKGMTSAAKIFHLLNRQPKIYDKASYADDKWVADGRVQYSRVHFCYPTRSGIKVLSGLDLSVLQGHTVALVGPSGCGKSTCIQLLERFYDPIQGSVSLDERDVSTVLMASLRSQLGIVSQEPVLFDRTIAENIAYGDNSREVPLSEIMAAARNANIHNFIASLPAGYDTRMGEKGAQLSGGQKQRVAIARALVRNPRVLLLDEATSALDTESEKVVQEALDKAKEGRTCITIAHRLSTIQNADVICVVNHGKIAELGKHSELIAKRGMYYKLFSLQNGQR
ncbi:ATP-dependent translocase ABCB1 [Anabrus simplex]|uniref:ATP-dependent translocase ABCB1 n=1 Tax=Anabrus simplex TaxID=316456 RepID=UPI0035A361C9